MKIIDCITFFDEEMLLDFRLNQLNDKIDKFVIVESKFTHSGKKKKLNFDIKKYSNFKNKIDYLVINEEPSDIHEVKEKDTLEEKNSKLILNGMCRDFYQRNYISNALKNIDPNDYVIISDLDEIPNLEKINLFDIKNKIIIFQQKNLYYKFNLYLENYTWNGSRACRYKYLKSPQWLRNIKSKNYPFWRVDTMFSKTKYKDIFFVEDGGWHFSYLKTPEDIEKKLKSYAHHREYDLEPIGIQNIKEIIKNKKAIYDLKTDMRKSKFAGEQKLKILNSEKLPKYLIKNINKYKEWLE